MELVALFQHLEVPCDRFGPRESSRGIVGGSTRARSNVRKGVSQRSQCAIQSFRKRLETAFQGAALGGDIGEVGAEPSYVVLEIGDLGLELLDRRVGFIRSAVGRARRHGQQEDNQPQTSHLGHRHMVSAARSGNLSGSGTMAR